MLACNKKHYNLQSKSVSYNINEKRKKAEQEDCAKNLIKWKKKKISYLQT